MTEIDIDAIIAKDDSSGEKDSDKEINTGADTSSDGGGSANDDASDDTGANSDEGSDESEEDTDTSDESSDDSNDDSGDDSEGDGDDGDGTGDDSGDAGDDDSGDEGDSEDNFDPDTLAIDIDGEEVTISDLAKKYKESVTKGAEARAIVDRIGGNEFLMKFNDFVLDGGDPEEYLQRTTVDYDKKTDIDIIKSKIDRENAGLDDDIKKTLYERELSKKYNIDLTGEAEGFSEDDIKIGEALLKRDASKERTELKKSQEAFQFPDKEKVASEEVAKAKERDDEWSQRVDSDESVINILETGMIQLGAEDNPFNFEVTEPEAHVQTAKVQAKFFEKLLDESGNVDLKLWLKLNAYASDPTGFENSLIEHGSATGEKKIVSEKKKISGKVGSKAVKDSEVGNLGLLHAFRDRGIKS